MKMVRAFGASVLLASGLFATSQGCALFTCIEDCDSVSSSGGSGGVGGSGEPTASASLTATAATSTGVGGEGGNAPCTDCPVCSAELDGPALSVTVLTENAYVLVDRPGTSAVFELAIGPDGFGDAVPLPGNPYSAGGRLVGTTTSVVHVTENLFEDIFTGDACDTAQSIIGAAAAGADMYFLFAAGLKTFQGCEESDTDQDFAGALSIAATTGTIAFHGGALASGPCFTSLPLDVDTAPSCLATEMPLAVAVDPPGKRILFRDISHVYSWEADPSAPAEVVVDFGGAEEPGLPIAANKTEVFFARSNAAETMWRCQLGPPYTCRSSGTEPVTSIHVEAFTGTAYFTMGSRVCRWP